jgi:predicted phage terminase large subunit-like protein
MSINDYALREILLQDFTRYLRWSFKTKYNSKIILKEFHLKVCRALIRVYQQETKNLIINMPPRSGKTEILNTFCEWTLTKHPESKNIMTSYSDTLVTNNSQSIRDMIRSNEHQQLFGIETKKDSTAKKLWKTNKDGGLYAVSSFGQITGFGAGLKNDGWGGFIGIDDPLKPDDRDSLLKLGKVKDWYETTLSNRKNKPDTPIIIIMQRLHTNDLVGCILNDEFGDLNDWEVIQVSIIDEDNKISLWEDFYPYEKLMTIKEKNESYYYSQFQQNPIIKGGNIFKSEWIKYISRDVIESIDFERYLITVDSALKDKEKNDYTVYSAFGFFENKLYYIDMFRGKPRSREREVTAKSFYDKNYKYPFDGMYIEQKASGIDMFQRLIDDGYMVVEVERNTDKVFRAENITRYIEIHGLFVAEDLPNLNDFLGEYSSFPNSKNDDIIDTLIDAIEISYSRRNASFADIDMSQLLTDEY